MKKMVLLVVISGAILTSCGNNVNLETETTQEHEFVETIETEKIEVEELDIETVRGYDNIHEICEED